MEIISEDVVELYTDAVTDYSSQYGSETSISYIAANLVGPPKVYPKYGDFAHTCVFRTYGTWWQQSKHVSKPFGRGSYQFNHLDYIEISFSIALYPRKVEIYETYNPGSIVRILACDTSPSADSSSVDRARWFTLWKADGPSICPPQTRIFNPPLKQCPFPTSLIRLEMDSSVSDYYPELDAVALVGSQSTVGVAEVDEEAQDEQMSPDAVPKSGDSLAAQLTRLHFQDGITAALSDNGLFDILPSEVLQLILCMLDYRSLCRLACVCKLFCSEVKDSMQYQEVNFQPLWTQVTDLTLKSFKRKCLNLKKLNLSWCGPYNHITVSSFIEFITNVGHNLSVLQVACCHFMTDSSLTAVALSCPQLKELNLSSCCNIKNFDGLSGFWSRTGVCMLQWFNLYRTKITTPALVQFLQACPHLTYLNLGSCINIEDMDQVMIQLNTSCRKLTGLDLWRSRTLSSVGLMELSHSCTLLEELDIGWCSNLISAVGCFAELAQNCRRLRKIFLTANRTVSDTDIKCFSENLPYLQQLDILGTNDVKPHAVDLLLQRCSVLNFLDLSFCSCISSSDIEQWNRLYPHINIKRSFQTI